MNRPLIDTRLKGGIEEVNLRLQRYVSEDESFDAKKWYKAYNDIFAQGGRLSDEGYFVAGLTLVGLAMRQGETEIIEEVFDKFIDRFDEKNDFTHEFLRGLIRTRRQTIKRDYYGFLRQAGDFFVQSISAEEFPRPQLSRMIWITAEIFRRQGDLQRAANWYLTLASMPETQPNTRKEIRDMNRAPNLEAPSEIHLGWRADEMLKELAERGVIHGKLPSGNEARLLNAIIADGFAGPDYSNPNWRPNKGADHQAVALMIREVGIAALDFVHRSGAWPDQLNEMWQVGLVRNWNTMNRFHCPNSGEPLQYRPIGGNLEDLPQQMVLVSCPKPIALNVGPRYGAFLADLSVVWSETPLQPGELYEGR